MRLPSAGFATNSTKSSAREIEEGFTSFQLSESLLTLYGFIWDDFFNFYLEAIKPTYGQPIDRQTYEATVDIFSDLMIVLHPAALCDRRNRLAARQKEERTASSSPWPKSGAWDADLINRVETAKDIIGKIRDIRNQNQIKPREELKVLVQDGDSARALFGSRASAELCKMAVLSELSFTNAEVTNAKSFIAGTEQYYVELNQEIDVAAERAKIEKELEYHRGFVKSVDVKLSNERFVSGAPAQVVENERKKRDDGLARIKILEEALAKLG